MEEVPILISVKEETPPKHEVIIAYNEGDITLAVHTTRNMCTDLLTNQPFRVKFWFPKPVLSRDAKKPRRNSIKPWKTIEVSTMEQVVKQYRKVNSLLLGFR